MSGRQAKKYRMELYNYLYVHKAEIMSAIASVADDIRLPSEYKGQMGLLGGSGSPPPVLNEVAEAMDKASRSLVNVASLDFKLRKIVKSVYGDEWDAACVSTCEAALFVSSDVLFAPSFLQKGDGYRSTYIAPYERHIHHQGGYGAPFPPRYKDIAADRGATAGELSMYAKRLYNTKVVFVPLTDASYACHGIKYHPCPLLVNVDPNESVKRINDVAEIHAHELAGFTSICYDTPGYGHTDGENRFPRLAQGIGEVASQFGVPFLADNARGAPFVGVDPESIDCDVIAYSADKAFGGPTAGLMIGREEVMTQIRRATGTHGQRWGTPVSHGKAGYVAMDPGKEALSGLIAALEILRDAPERLTARVDRLHELAEEISDDVLNEEFKNGVIISKSHNCLDIEINYQNTWNGEEWGLPIFSVEDMYSGTNLIQYGIGALGIGAPLSYDANILVGPLNLSTSDDELDEDKAALGLKALFGTMNVLWDYVKRAESEQASA